MMSILPTDRFSGCPLWLRRTAIKLLSALRLLSDSAGSKPKLKAAYLVSGHAVASGIAANKASISGSDARCRRISANTVR